MTFKPRDQILEADPRFASLAVIDDAGARVMDITDHHRAIGSVSLLGEAPLDVRAAFDRGRNILLYAYFAYDLLVVGESQALAAFEFALKHRLAGHPVKGMETLRNLVDRARKHGILSAPQPSGGMFMDPVEAMIHMRNALAHGTADIHSPGMAMDVLEACAREIDSLFPHAAQ